MAQRSFLSRMTGGIVGGPPKLPPFSEAGVSGTPIYGGYVKTTEKNFNLTGQARYLKASDLLTNVSIVAAGVRYFLNLCAKPSWKVVPANDTDEAKQVAEFVEDCLFGMKTSWSRIIRRGGMFRYHGFGIHEWTAVKRADGKIGLDDIEPRPQHTIWRWGTDDRGSVTGVYQRDPQTGREIWLPRSKIVYLVDDMMTDSPEGLGWFRQLVEPADRIQNFLRLEMMGYERNLVGTPIGRAPYGDLENKVAAGLMTKADKDNAVRALHDFVQMQRKTVDTSIVLDSSTYASPTADGQNFTNVYKWGVDLLTGQMTGIEHLATAIDREIHQAARIMGIENILLGADGKGSMALSKTQSENMYLVINSTVQDMAEAFDRDAIGPIMDLNGISPELRPTLKAEDVAFKDITELAQVLSDLATAGAVIGPNDPAVNDIRALAGLPEAPEMTPDELGAVGALGGTPPAPAPIIPPANDPGPEQAAPGQEAEVQPGNAKPAVNRRRSQPKSGT